MEEEGEEEVEVGVTEIGVPFVLLDGLSCSGLP